MSANKGDDRQFGVRICRLKNGERLPLVVDAVGIPVPRANQWAMLLRRPQVQENTLTDEMRTVAHVHEWASRRCLDLEGRLQSGNGLTPAEADALFQNLRYWRTSGRRVAGEPMVDARGLDIVDWKTHATRVAVARNYLLWGMEQTLYGLDVTDPRTQTVRERCEMIRRRAFEFQRPGVDTKMPRRGLSKELRNELLSVIEPDSPRNPFTRNVRFRNYVLILMLLTYGFRRGEALKIKLSDANVRGRSPRLSIVRRPGDPDDPRANPPAVKTLGRELPMHPQMARVLNEYIQFHRSQYPSADDSPFLFLSSSGTPMSIRSVNAIFTQITKRHRQFAGVLVPHVLRYTYNDALKETARSEGLDAQAFKAMQNYLNGWTLTSSQGDQYSRRANEERAREISAKHQERIFQ